MPRQLCTAIPSRPQFEAQEAARRASSGSVVVDPTPLRAALAALPGHNFRVGACGAGAGAGVGGGGARQGGRAIAACFMYPPAPSLPSK